MIQMQQTPQVPAALQALMVLKQQASPVTPQGTPTIAAQTAQQMMQPPSMLPQTPPQGVGLSGIAQNVATGNAIQDQQAAQANDEFRRQMLEQQKAKAQQPVLAAEGGIASLDVDGMDDYAEGGVVGYNGTEGSFADATTAANRDFVENNRIEDPKTLKDFLINTLLRPLSRTTDQVEMLRSLINSASENRKASAKLVSDLAATVPEETPQPVVPMIPNKGLEEPTGGQAPREERRPPSPRLDSGIAAPRQAAARQAAAPATIPGEDLYQAALKLADQYKGSDGRTAEQIERDRLAEYQRRGLPDLRRAAEERMRQVGEFDAETRRQFVEGNKAAMQNAWASGILQPGARNLAELFGGAARSMIGEEGRQAQAAAALRAGERAQMILDNQIREALDKADKAAADGDITTAQAEKAKAQELHNKKLDVQREMMMNRAKEVVDYRKTMDAERLRQSGAERLAEMRGEAGADTKKLLAYARVQQAINSDPQLKELARLAALDPNGTQAAAYKRAVEELTLKLAPELLTAAERGTTSPAPTLRFNPATGKIE